MQVRLNELKKKYWRASRDKTALGNSISRDRKKKSIRIACYELGESNHNGLEGINLDKSY